MPRSMFNSTFQPKVTMQLGAAPAGITSWVADNLCKIVEAMGTGPIPGPAEAKIYQDAFNEWYGKVANVPQHEKDTTEFVSKFCPKLVNVYNSMRAQWMRDDARARERSRRPTPPPLPPAGPPVASEDPLIRPRAPRPKPPTPTPTPPIVRRPPVPPPVYPPVPSVDPAAAPRPGIVTSPPPRPRPTPPSIPTGGGVSMLPPTQSQPFYTTATNVQEMTQGVFTRNFQSDQASMPSTGGQGGCPPGQFPSYPGGPCRGSVAPGAAGLISAAASMAPAAAATPSLAPSMPSMPGGTMTMMGRKRGGSSMEGRQIAIRGRHSDGALEWWGYQQSFIPELYFARPRVNKAVLSGLPIPEGVCCQATKDGGAICSNGQGFPPTCPNKPTPNVPGVAEYIQQGAYLVPKPPPAAANGSCGAAAPAAATPAEGDGSGAAPLVGLAAVGALLYAVVDGLI